MATYDPTPLALAGERPRLIAPLGPVSIALAVMAADQTKIDNVTLDQPQFAVARLDLTGAAIAIGCIACWIAPAVLVITGALS